MYDPTCYVSTIMVYHKYIHSYNNSVVVKQLKIMAEGFAGFCSSKGRMVSVTLFRSYWQEEEKVINFL